MKIQKIDGTNWNNILEIQGEAYQEVGLEDVEVLKSKVAASPDTCFVSVSEKGVVLGYLLAHPWSGAQPPKLFEPLPCIEASEYLYLHDMAVSAQSKGQGIGRSMFEALFKVALRMGANKIRLVAVQGSGDFWALFGFREIPGASVYSSYGKHAVLMEKVLKA